MRLPTIFILLLVSVVTFSACELLDPENDNHSTLDRVYGDPEYAEGLLIRAYDYIPTNDYRWDEVATDDAVTNDNFSSYLRIATGEWSALYNPQNLWDNNISAIMSINQFLDVVDEVPWKQDETLNNLYIRRFRGEAYALRGMMKYFLLRNHGGVGTNGELLGIPEYNEFLESEDDFSMPRENFSESVQSAYDDLEEALTYLPLDYGDVGSTGGLPAGFEEITNIDDYNTVFGDWTQQRMSGRHAKAIKARLALLAASPAFNPNNDLALWEEAAQVTADLLDDIGGIGGIDPDGHIFYLPDQVAEADLTGGDEQDLQEILWRRPIYNNNARERANFPPSLYGDGRINPTQNLVDAFPMANGYPITDENSEYDPNDPYANRDPRLSLYIVYDGSTMRGNTINMEEGDDAVGALQNSTRTGYYMKKMLREDVNVDPSSSTSQRHFNTHIRYTELFLNYAEAANEAWGPNGSSSYAFSAKDVIAAIRERAGIEQPDSYLESISDQDAMRQLIRNERRLELCFESFRFWDLRRWKEDLTVPARGIQIDGNSYSTFNVEERAYNNEYMHYGPIPDGEINKFNLIQNDGWN